jgi:hypothetical protein
MRSAEEIVRIAAIYGTPMQLSYESDGEGERIFVKLEPAEAETLLERAGTRRLEQETAKTLPAPQGKSLGISDEIAGFLEGLPSSGTGLVRSAPSADSEAQTLIRVVIDLLKTSHQSFRLEEIASNLESRGYAKAAQTLRQGLHSELPSGLFTPKLPRPTA